MKCAWMLAVLVPILCFADRSPTAKRDKALKSIRAEMRSKEYSSRLCGKLSADIGTLAEVYKQGDKSVLPTLFAVYTSGKSISCDSGAVIEHQAEFWMGVALGHHSAAMGQVPDKRQKTVISISGYLRAFYREALLTDSVAFLTTLSELPDRDQKVIAFAIAGGTPLGVYKETYDALETVLNGIPASAQITPTSQLCRKTLEEVNAPFLETYFPAKTFAAQDADFDVRRYTLAMYKLGEKPLWPVSAGGGTIYRFTYIPYGTTYIPYGPISTPAFSGPTVITLSVSGDGNARIAIKSSYHSRDFKFTKVDETRSVTSDELARILAQLDHSHFWIMPVDLPSASVTGADWVMEGVKDGDYRTVVRRCPDLDRQSAEEKQFAQAGRLLFEIAGHKWDGEFDLHCTHPRPYFSQAPNPFDPPCPTCFY